MEGFVSLSPVAYVLGYDAIPELFIQLQLSPEQNYFANNWRWENAGRFKKKIFFKNEFV